MSPIEARGFQVVANHLLQDSRWGYGFIPSIAYGFIQERLGNVSLEEFANLGLITLESNPPVESDSGWFPAHYQGVQLKVEAPSRKKGGGMPLFVLCCRPYRMGIQLLNIIERAPVEGYVDHLLQHQLNVGEPWRFSLLSDQVSAVPARAAQQTDED